MKNLKLMLCAGAATLGLVTASAAFADDAPAAAAPAPTPAPYPPFTPPIAPNQNPAKFDAGPFGELTVGGMFSAIGYAQDHALKNGSDKSASVDYANAFVTVQKTDGLVQFYVQAGGYSTMSLGAPYIKASTLPGLTFGVVPEAFVKIVPNSSFNVMAGQLPTLIGAEYTFSFQNMNIERGLLWNQEPAYSRGVQANYAHGPVSLSVAVTDGFYSKYLSTISVLGSYAFTPSDTLAFAGSWNTSHKLKSTSATPVATAFDNFGDFVTLPLQNTGDIYNVIYTHSSGPWLITPYFQYTHTPGTVYSDGVTLTGPSTSTWAVAVLTKYNFTPEFAIAARAEYISSSNASGVCTAASFGFAGSTPCSINVLYGPGSKAWSLTVTPTYQKGIYFLRGELSYTKIESGVPGFMLGPNFDQSSQFRGVIETGVAF